MIKQTIFFVSIIILCACSVNGQQHISKWNVGVYSGITNYRGDLSRGFYDPNDQILNLFDNLDYLSYGVSIAKRMNHSWSFRLMASRGAFEANDRGVDWNNNLVTDHQNFTRSLNVRTELNDLSLLGVWSLANDKILPTNFLIAPYFLIGGGYSSFENYADLYRNNGDRYYYWSDQTIRDMPENENDLGNIIQQDGDFETELEPLETEGVNYKNTLFHATIGVGLKFRLSKRISLNIESLYRLLNTDYLDDVQGGFLTDFDSPEQAYAANPASIESTNRGNTDNKKDRIHLTTISVHYNFGKLYEPYNAPAILIGDLYDTDKFQKVNKLPSSADTTYHPISVVPIIEQDSIFSMPSDEIEELEIPDFDMSSTDTLPWTNQVIADNSMEEYELVDTTNTIIEEVEETLVFPQSNTGEKIDLATTQNSLTEVDRIAISNPVIEQPPLTIKNTIIDTTEIQIIENAPMPIVSLDKNKEEPRFIISADPRTDSLYWQVSQLSSNIGNLRAEQRSDRAQNEVVVNQRLAIVQAELDSLRANQARNNNELSEQWRADFQLAMTAIEKQIRETKNPTAGINNSQAEIDGMRREMESMRTYLTTTQQKNSDRSELEEYKRQLWLYEIQSQNIKENTQERQKLETEINSLKAIINRQQETAITTKPAAPTPVIIPAPTKNGNDEEIQALKAEIINLNDSMAEMRRLLAEQNNQNEAASKAELLTIKTEIAKLSNSVNTNTNESHLINQLKAELEATRLQLAELSNAPTPTPTPTPTPAPPTIITNTVVAPPPTAYTAIAGRERQLVFFQLGAAQLDAPSMQIIQSLAQLMNQYPEVYAELEGFTDPSGKASGNLILSGKRAAAVQHFLVQYGIAANRLIVIPRGEDSASDASYGRRVAISLKVR